MSHRETIIAVGLLTQADVERLGSGFKRIYKVDETPCFGDLLRAIDDADRAMRIGRPDGDAAVRT